MDAVDRILHRLGIGFAPIGELLLDLETALFGKRALQVPIERPVFIIGLARAGTSILARALHGTGCFATLTYRDMPFPLAPNLWAYLSAMVTRTTQAVERGHGDGLTHDLDSPEAIEEVFWRLREGRHYILADRLREITPARATLDDFRQYVSMILLRNPGKRYLSKNNNSILRVRILAAAFPDAVFLHPVRDPLQQAISLLKQHRRAVEIHRADHFRAQYMQWLAHHEFGSDHRPFDFGNTQIGENPQHPDYWLQQWITAYRHLRDTSGTLGHFIDYDEICRVPIAGTERIARLVGVALSAFPPSLFREVPKHVDEAFSPALVEEAYVLHRQICRT